MTPTQEITPELKAAALRVADAPFKASDSDQYALGSVVLELMLASGMGILAALVRQQDAELAKAQAEVERLRKALTDTLDVYVRLANSGDAGFWNPEEEDHVIAARAALNPQPKQEEKR